MATFNSMPAMTAATASETMAMAIAAGSGQHMVMEHFDHALNFDEALL